MQALAADLAAERRRVLLLRRENRQLRARLAALGELVDEVGGGPVGEAPHGPEGRAGAQFPWSDRS